VHGKKDHPWNKEHEKKVVMEKKNMKKKEYPCHCFTLYIYWGFQKENS
jgi:hypothetical protein